MPGPSENNSPGDNNIKPVEPKKENKKEMLRENLTKEYMLQSKDRPNYHRLGYLY